MLDQRKSEIWKALGIGPQWIERDELAKAAEEAVKAKAQAAAVYACQLARGEDIQTDRKAYDGTYDVPAVVLEPIAVNADNMQEVIINSGFHLKEEVYLNVRD